MVASKSGITLPGRLLIWELLRDMIYIFLYATAEAAGDASIVTVFIVPAGVRAFSFIKFELLAKCTIRRSTCVSLVPSFRSSNKEIYELNAQA